MQEIEKFIRNVPDFPKEGIQFKDITPLLAEPKAFGRTLDWFAEAIEKHGSADVIMGIESRGFIFGAAIAQKLAKPFVPVRKPGKLPWQTKKIEYELEYGTDALEIHVDAVSNSQRVAIVDDLLATGGTAAATAKLVKELGGQVVSCTFLIELAFLKGREPLKTAGVEAIDAILTY